MKIKHSKFKNTGLIFELLTKQLAADILSNSNSAAISIIKKHFSNHSPVAKEYKLYEYITSNKGISGNRANAIISTILEISRKFNREALNKQKYQLIADIKESYDIDEFFSIKTQNYKPLAALYCLTEAHNSEEVIIGILGGALGGLIIGEALGSRPVYAVPPAPVYRVYEQEYVEPAPVRCVYKKRKVYDPDLDEYVVVKKRVCYR